jgi:hypothetical protein
MERPILGAAGLQFIRRSPSSGRPTDRGGRKDIPGFRHQGCSPFRERSACGTTRSSSTTGSSHGASLARVPFIADGSFEVFVGRLVVAAFFKAFAKRFALALLGKVCRLLRLLVERLAIF